jgi:hypothetical protein
VGPAADYVAGLDGLGSGCTGYALRWTQLNWFGYLLLVGGRWSCTCAGPYPSAVLLTFGFTGRRCDTLSWLHAGCGAAW